MPAYNYQPADIEDFSLGVTDDYVNGDPRHCYELFNLSLLDNNSVITRIGTLLDSETDAQIPVGSSRVQTLISYNNSDKLFVHNAKKIYYRDPTNYASLLGPTSQNPLELSDANANLSFTEWNRHLIICSDAYDKPIKIYKDTSDDYQIRTAGLPTFTAPTVTGTAGAYSYVYGFCWKYTYQIEDQTFVDQGPVTLVQLSHNNTPDLSSVSIGSVPTVTNGTGDNYDTGELYFEIYRTINGGQELYKIAEYKRSTWTGPTYTDTLSDTALQDNETIYTSGGVPNNDAPPKAKFVHTVNNYTYYGHLKEGTEVYPSVIRQSQANDPDSVPASFNEQLEDEITGISSTQDVLIVGCKKHIYRIEGAFDSVGRGAMSHKRISDKAGCISHESMIQTDDGLFWFGNDGIYYTDGYKVLKVTSHLDKRYKQYLANLRGKHRKIKGAYVSEGSCLYWTIQTNSSTVGQEECDAMWVIDLTQKISAKMTCYFWNGGDSFYPTSIAYHNGQLYRGDRKGYVLKFDEDTYTDPKIDTAVSPSLWTEEAILWKATTIASNFGSSFSRKIANKVLVSCKNETNISMLVTAVNDDGKLERGLKPIRTRGNFTWGDETFIWGDPNFIWSYGGSIEVDRRLPSGGLRFNYLQLRFENDFTNIVNSDLKGTVTVNSTTDQATLTTVGKTFSTEYIDYFLYLENDNYTRGYRISAVSTNTLNLVDTGSNLVDGTWKFQIKGYRKGERVNLLGYSISWAFTSRSHDTYNNGQDGGLNV